MAVREASSNKIADHYFTVEEHIKPNEGIPTMLKKIYEGGFTEQQVMFSSIIGKALGEISLMIQEIIKVNVHYVVPLPLK